MEKVLLDIHFVDGYIGTLPASDSTKAIAASYYTGIYKKFGIDSAAYAKSMGYYYKHPEILNTFYVNVQKKIEAARDKNDKRVAAVNRREQDELLVKNNRYLRVDTAARNLTFKISENPFTIEPSRSLSPTLPLVE